jgi:sugar/nucleoside kinase (ribokinase family)
MSTRSSGPVACFSYLAAAELWNVAHFPAANHGAEVLAIEHSVAADGPMVAAVLAAVGVPALLLANDVGDDADGAAVREWLRRHHVATTADTRDRPGSPRIVVVADNAGTRTWFPHLPGVADQLERLDLALLAGASSVYIDCYELIRKPAVRAIRACQAAGVPVLVNLGGSPLDPGVAEVLRGHSHLIIQTNAADDCMAEAHRIAAAVLEDTGAGWVVVTAGASGALALSQAGSLSVPAFRADVRHTHCAGAAFSGGLLYGLHAGWPMADSLALASASGALRCERAHHEPMPTLAELRAVVASRERAPVSAA